MPGVEEVVRWGVVTNFIAHLGSDGCCAVERVGEPEPAGGGFLGSCFDAEGGPDDIPHPGAEAANIFLGDCAESVGLVHQNAVRLRDCRIRPCVVWLGSESRDELRRRDDADEVPVEVLESPGVASSKLCQRAAELPFACPARAAYARNAVGEQLVLLGPVSWGATVPECELRGVEGAGAPVAAVAVRREGAGGHWAGGRADAAGRGGGADDYAVVIESKGFSTF